jgi:hypothetical protein
MLKFVFDGLKTQFLRTQKFISETISEQMCSHCMFCVSEFLFEIRWRFLQECYSNLIHFPVFYGAACPSGPGPSYYRCSTITLRNNTLGRTPLDERSARRRELYLLNTTLTRNRFHASGGILTQSQQTGGRSPTPSTAQPKRSATY